jgi:hypothetical protein
LVPLKAELHLHCIGFIIVRVDDHENGSNREKISRGGSWVAKNDKHLM